MNPEPFCDGFAATFPQDELHNLRYELLSTAAEAGGLPNGDGSYRFPGTGRGGLLKVHQFHSVARVAASGQCLAAMRSAGVWEEFLSCLANRPHRITHADVTVDISGADSPAYLTALYERAKAGKVALSRKCMKPTDCHRMWGPSLYDDRETGTVYLGHRGRHEVWGKAYDKRQERLRYGADDPGNLLRLEIGISGQTRVSMHDVYDPTACFYHYAAPSLIQPQSSVPLWQAAGEGFVLPPRDTPLPADRLKSFITRGDADALLLQVDRLKQPLTIGLDYLQGLLADRLVQIRRRTH